MEVRLGFLIWVTVILTILDRVNSVSASCHFSVVDDDKLYNYTLDSPIPFFPHGVQSEDGFYKVAANETVLWFQDCVGASCCDMGSSALVSNNIGGYDVCTTIGRASSMDMNIIDRKNPNTGVIVKMSSSGLKFNCSLSVSGPHLLEKTGKCDYATVLTHPSGCAKIEYVHGRAWGWFGTLGIIILCLFGAYLLVGAAYRYIKLGVRGIHIIPNLDFWTTLRQSTQSLFASLLHKFRGSSHGHRSTYSPVNF
ncbi:hypothetical protein DVH24_024380 [Malus domestica]|uniref:Autophagy-related protein 27 n=1 Tax=Malus domestica TaxID=3750 RepID=A0A498JHY0_MALDO|nr:hypothetical protein DVH24_024380 [Malus domestica]